MHITSDEGAVMPMQLFRCKPASVRAEDDSKTRAVVEATLRDIEARGDAAVRALSEKFDNYTKPSFRLSDSEVDAIISKVAAADLADIRFANAQVTKFAEAQRESLRDIEVETLPGVILGHRNIPVQSVGCYVPGGKFPMIASAHMSVATASVAGVPRIVAATPPFKGEPNPATIAAIKIGGATEIYVLGGIQAGCGLANILKPTAISALLAMRRRLRLGGMGLGCLCWKGLLGMRNNVMCG